MLKALKNKIFSKPETKFTPAPDDDYWYQPRLSTGAALGHVDEALQSIAVYACVRILAQTVGMLPLIMYRRTDDKNINDRAMDHPLYRILHDAPNIEQTSVEFREQLMTSLALRGNAYVWKEYNRRGEINALFPLHPDTVRAYRSDKGRAILYDVKDGNVIRTYPQNRILHLKLNNMPGAINGLSPIAQTMRAVGISIQADTYGERFFENSALPAGIIKYPGSLEKAEVRENLRKNWNAIHGGALNSGKPGVLPNGAEWQSISINPDEAQFLETRKFQVNEIARLFGIPPHMIGDVERSTSWGTGIEQQSLGFVIYTLLPWLRRWEQSLNRGLLYSTDRDQYFFEFKVDGLLRGDSKARGEFYRLMREIGALSANEVRALENLNPLDGEQGDKYFIPSNWTPADKDFDAPQPVPPGLMPQGDETEDDDDGEEEENRRLAKLLAQRGEIGAKPNGNR